MIEANEIFSDSDSRIAIFVEGMSDTNDLAVMCDNVVNNGIRLISVPSEIIHNVWTYLEKTGVKILTRHNFNPISKNIDSDMYELGAGITKDHKSGANGVQIFVKMHDFENFIDGLKIVRDDLFFGHDLSIVMDTGDIDINDIDLIFTKLREIHANSFVLTLNEDMGNRSDFVGRIYGLLQNFDFDGELHFILGNNFDRIDQVIRLTEILRPELNGKLRFFLDY